MKLRQRKPEIRIRAKGGEERVILLTTEARGLILDYLQASRRKGRLKKTDYATPTRPNFTKRVDTTFNLSRSSWATSNWQPRQSTWQGCNLRGLTKRQRNLGGHGDEQESGTLPTGIIG